MKWNIEIEEALEDLYGRRIRKIFALVIWYTLYTKNSMGILIYLFCFLFSFVYSFAFLIDKHLNGPYLHQYHKIITFIFVINGWLSYLNALFSEPMTVKEKLKIGKDFEEYDGVMFEKN